MAFGGAGHDEPTTPASAPYASCPEGDAAVAPYAGGGRCVPEAVVENLSDQNSPLYNPLIADLKQDNCGAGEKCVPSAKAANPRHCATPCKTSETLASLGYPEGACMPTYAAFDANGQAGVAVFKGQGGAPAGCKQDEVCYPCGNPLRGGLPTGVCF
jgi:hypothetical protein